MYLLTPLTPPTAEPVTVDAAKAALRIDDQRFDGLLPGLIASARAVAEQETGRQLVRQVWRAELADWPDADRVFAVHQATACAISYWSGSAWSALAGNAFAYAPNGEGTSIAPALGTSWPELGAVALGPRVRIDLTAGVAPELADTVPECIKTFIVALVGQLVDAPELPAGAALQQHPLLGMLLDSQRLTRRIASA